MAEDEQPPFKPLLYKHEPANNHMQNIFYTKNDQQFPEFQQIEVELTEEDDYEKAGLAQKNKQINKASKDEVKSKLKQMLGEKLTVETEADLLGHLDKDVEIGEKAVNNDNNIQTDATVEMPHEVASGEQENSLGSYHQNEVGTTTSTASIHGIDEMKRQKIRVKIAHLARYWNGIETPVCEAIIDGQPIKFQVISKKGNFVKVKIGRHQKKFNIDDITDIIIFE
ncbi:hypothetical protein CVD25_09495 [Bacillus canaveralius]|uniref:Uncharacterized protein n=1 Tax=Bacillus canaveralius TaxID=1403243 RepID=A0A2N5GKL5_9BACI|nr:MULTISPECIES: hypothetical protein [Bacillus]PLR81441.1 hypothetical protein CVD23_18665 [Bacillus sp. V33-4]PLR82052.1 hypothetical protein CU635_12845 [Bacillus canaveralius]PLR98042.1 hypothetical protein CVD25_09495 [Bacillus canaveralius]RSK48677.1 hypothetical protein EJA13_16555 [Bacillus canaveralius]